MPTKTPKKTTEKVAEKPTAQRKDRYFYAVGKRKTSVARVRLYENGKGEFKVNGQPLEKYFYGELIGSTKAPLKLTELLKRFDIEVEAQGGGIASQADAVRHGIARAITRFDSSFRLVLKRAGYLTRDSRAKERKKPGLLRARRAPQWSKR